MSVNGSTTAVRWAARAAGTVAVFALVAVAGRACSDDPSDPEMAAVLHDLPEPEDGWGHIYEQFDCVDNGSGPVPPHSFAEGRGGGDNYLDTAEAALTDAGFDVQRIEPRTALGDLVAQRGAGASQIEVRIFSGPGRRSDETISPKFHLGQVAPAGGRLRGDLT